MKYALTHVNIITGNLEDDILYDYNIIINNAKILKITTDISEVEGLYQIDLNHRYLLPGLINLHVHLPGNGMPKDTKKQNKEIVRKLMSHKITKRIVKKICMNYAMTELKSGVTTIRCVGGLDNIDSEIRDSKKTNVPRILTSNMAISVPGGHMAGVLAYEALNKEDAINLVHKISMSKPDLIKLMITGGILDATKLGEPGVLRMNPEIVKAATNEAHKLGYKVAAHVESSEGVRVALEAGVDTIEHGGKITDYEIELFKKNNSAHILTISPIIPMNMLDQSVTHITNLVKYNSEVVFDGMLDCAKKCLENNILVGLGTDSACPYVTHYDMYRELIYFHKYLNVSNKFAIHTATKINATIAGISDITGSVEVSKSADFLIVDKNPLDDLVNLSSPSMVILKGNIIRNIKINKYLDLEKELNKFI